jgi:hypothetical protein
MSRYELSGGELEIDAGPQIQNPALPQLMMGASKAHVTLKVRMKAFAKALHNEAKRGACRLDLLDRYAQLAAKVKHPKHSADHWKQKAIHRLRLIAKKHNHNLVIAGYDFVGAGLQPPELDNLKRMTTERGMDHINKGATIVAQLFGAEQAAKTLESVARAIREGSLR